MKIKDAAANLIHEIRLFAELLMNCRFGASNSCNSNQLNRDFIELNHQIERSISISGCWNCGIHSIN